MSNIIHEGKIYIGIDKIRAKNADNQEEYVEFSEGGGATQGDLSGIIDGTITDFVMPSGKTIIKPYRFINFTTLKSIDLGNVREIGDYAFDGCTNVENIGKLPTTITKVGQYAMRSLAASKTTFEFKPAEKCTVGQYGFYGSKISKLGGGEGLSVGNYAFSNCSSLSEIEARFEGIGDYAFQNCGNTLSIILYVEGAIGAYAFYGLNRVVNVEIFSRSNITSLGNYCFSRLGGNRLNAESNILTFDFSNSTFSAIPQYAFGSDSSSARNRYMRIIFPKTVSEISSYAFRYSDNCDFYFKSETPPTMSSNSCWQNATSYKIFVPFGSINAYRSATNWNAQADYMKGYVPAGTFSVGDTLPELNAEGYELTWYSDKACTTQVTTVTSEAAEYYCTAGSGKVGYGIKSISAEGCTVSITDSNGKSYTVGAGVRPDTVLTITGIPTTAGYVPYMFKVNDADFVSGSTLTVSSDIKITAIYWDGTNLPINPTFADNSWTMIRSAFRAGTALQFWHVGDTKSFTSKSGKNYTFRIADMTAGRYNLADGSGTTNGVLELVELYNLNGKTNWQMNNTQKEGQWTGGGYALSDMANIYLQQIFEDMPDEVKEIISEITLNEYSYTSPSPRSGNHKLFLPAETEMFDARHYSAEGVQTGCPKYAQFGYYAENNTNAARIKRTVGTTSANWYWLRSAQSANSGGFCVVTSGGSYVSNRASYNGGVAPCFAI